MTSLELDDEFMRIEAAVCAYDEDADAPLRKGESPFQWSSIEKDSRALLERASDPRVAGWYGRAAMATRGLDGLVDGLDALLVSVDAFEQASATGGDDAEKDADALAIAMAWLASPRFAYALSHARLSSEEDAMTLGDLVTGQGAAKLRELPQGTRDATRASIAAAFDAFALLTARVGSAVAESLRLAEHRALLTDALAALGERGAAAPAVKPAAAPPGAGADAGAEDAVRSRADAAAMLERLIAYFETYEPGHPARLFLLRIRRMLGASFEALMAELYADADMLIARIDRPGHA